MLPQGGPLREHCCCRPPRTELYRDRSATVVAKPRQPPKSVRKISSKLRLVCGIQLDELPHLGIVQHPAIGLNQGVRLSQQLDKVGVREDPRIGRKRSALEMAECVRTRQGHEV